MNKGPVAALFNFNSYNDKLNFSLNAIIQLIKIYKTNIHIRETALTLLRTVRERDEHAEIEKIFNFVRDKIRYTNDVRNVETLQTPVVTLRFGQGDCDDQTSLLNALLESVGYKTRIVIVSQDPRKKVFTHIYSEVFCGGQWIALDPIRPVKMGMIPSDITNRRVFSYE